jgi:hypothetical protein
MYCNNCGKPNPKNSKFCQNCGIKLKGGKAPKRSLVNRELKLSDEPEGTIDSQTTPYPYVVSIKKFLILSVFTLGIYELYWLYKQFKSFKTVTPIKGPAWLLALFGGITAYSLFKTVANAVKSITPAINLKAGLWALIYLAGNCLAFLPSPYSYFGYLSFLAFVPVQQHINYYWMKVYGDRVKQSTFSKGNVVWCIVGSVMILFVAYGTFGMDENGNDTFFRSLSVNNADAFAFDESIAQDNWLRFDSDAKSFSQSFPAEPTKEVDNSGDYPASLFYVEVSDRLSYFVNVIEYDDTVETSNPGILLNDVLNSIATFNENTELVSSKSTRYQDYTAKEFSIREGEIMAKGRLILVENRLYQVFVSYYESDGVPADYERFMKSFVIN